GAASFAKNLAAALARHSSHPVSQAVTKLSTEAFGVSEWQEIRGGGVEATLGAPAGESIKARLGSFHWLESCGVQIASGKPFEGKWSAQGASVLGLALYNDLLAVVALQDALKPHARDVVTSLKNTGLKVFLVTGDNPRTAATIAQQAGIPTENVFA